MRSEVDDRAGPRRRRTAGRTGSGRAASRGTSDDAAGGDVASEGFDAFYQREYRDVVGLAYVLSGSRTAAEDLAQDAMLSAYRQWDRVAAMDNPVGYVRRTAANLAVSGARRRLAEAGALVRLAGRREPLAELDPPDEEFWRAVRALPARQAQVVALRYVYDCPVAEVAAVLGMAEGTARAHLHRARAALSRSLGLVGDEPGSTRTEVTA